jgi:hypothetical protein
VSIPEFKLRCEIFRDAEAQHPDLMEPFANRLADAGDDAEQLYRIMGEGLAATFRQRYPMPEGVAWPAPMVEREVTTA